MNNERTKTVDITSREFKANPFPFYAHLRAEEPVYRTILPDKQVAWIISRYDDVMAILKDEEHFLKNLRTAKTPEQLAKIPRVPKMFQAFEENILGLDGIDHNRLRGLIHKAFTPRLIEDMRDRVQEIADELLDEAEKRGEMDLIADYALPIPLTIIMEILGIPLKDRNKFHRWTKSLVNIQGNHQAWRTIPYMVMFIYYLRRLFRERRKNLQDDLVSALVQAEEAGDQLSEDELLAMVFVLIIAGHETTVNLIASGILALLQHPDQMDKLRNDPTLIKPAVEELLRYTCPVIEATERYAAEDITLHGVTIPKGELVLVGIGSANHDERQFPNPEAVDITRESNKHVAFGQGVHYCVGAPLARLEGAIAINTLLRRLPNLRLKVAPEQLRWRQGMTLRGLEALPVEF